MKNEFLKIRSALEEHLAAINENTAEVQALFDYIHEIEVKVEKISSRLDQMQLSQEKIPEKMTVSSLTQMEKKVFLVLYTEEESLTYEEIAQKSSLPSSLVPECVSALVNKGIPLGRSMFKNQLMFKMSPIFKEMQAKENIVNLSLQSFME
jgi:predicted nuclease with TOPRIM domain